MIYNLTEADQEFVREFVQRLEVKKRGVPSKLYGDKGSRHHRTIGLGAEYAFSQLFDLPFNDSITLGGDGGNDFTLTSGLTIQIKCRGQRGRDFAVMPDLSDFQSDIGVLMWPVTPEIKPLAGFEVVGWVSKVSFFLLAERLKLKAERLVVPFGKMHNPDLLPDIINANP